MLYENQNGVLVPVNKLIACGRYSGELIREGRVIDEFEQDNLVVNEGLNYLLGVALQGVTQLSSWYMGLFSGNYTPVAADTGSSIASNATEVSAYSSASRPSWTPAAASGQTITNAASRAVFTFTASANIYGAFIASNSVIGGSSGTLFGAARFSSMRQVQSGDQLLMTYAFSLASA